MSDEEQKNIEISKYWTFNQTGNILVSSTVQEEKDLRESVVIEFQKVSVLYDAISTSIARANRSKHNPDNKDQVYLGLFNYAAISAIMSKSGFFALLSEEDKHFKSTSSSLSINTQIITEILAGFISGGGSVMNIAKRVLGSLGGKAKEINLSKSKITKNARLGHMLFVCEDIMGMPLITVQVFSTALDQMSWALKTPCASSTTSTITMDYRVETFMFVDPEYIAKFSSQFKVTPDFDELVTRLSNIVDDHVDSLESNDSKSDDSKSNK